MTAWLLDASSNKGGSDAQEGLRDEGSSTTVFYRTLDRIENLTIRVKLTKSPLSVSILNEAANNLSCDIVARWGEIADNIGRTKLDQAESLFTTVDSVLINDESHNDAANDVIGGVNSYGVGLERNLMGMAISESSKDKHEAVGIPSTIKRWKSNALGTFRTMQFMARTRM